MVRVPGHVPHVPPPSGKGRGRAEKAEGQPFKGSPPEQIGRGPELDAHAIAVAMSIAARKAMEKELSFKEIMQRVIDLTGLTNPEAAMEEANRLLQKEIEETIEKIKRDKDLMEEAEGWEEFGRLLESEMSEEQIKEFIGLINKELQ